jgi:hypothetical protein
LVSALGIGGIGLANIDLAAEEAQRAALQAQKAKTSKTINFEPADFTSYDLTTFRGDKITVSVDGPNFCIDCDCSDDIVLGLYDAEYFDLITTTTHSEGTFADDFTDYMEEDTLYMVNVSYVV